MSATIGTLLYTFLKGKKVGKDDFGNCYYVQKCPAKNTQAKRWVIYNGKAEPSKIPALWHSWIHYTSDVVPSDHPRTPYFWEKKHLPNLTGTKGAYFPEGHEKATGLRAKSASDYQAWEPK